MSDRYLDGTRVDRCRKDYACDWCGESIGKASPLSRLRFVGDDGPYSMVMHPECEGAWSKADTDDVIDGWSPGDFERPDAVGGEAK